MNSGVARNSATGGAQGSSFWFEVPNY